MHCISCGAEVQAGTNFCPACGAAVPTVLSTQSGKPIMYQPTSFPADAEQPGTPDNLTTEPVRSYAPAQPEPVQPVYVQPVYMQTPAPKKKASNGQAVTGLVFNIINLALLLIASSLVRNGGAEGAATSLVFLIVSGVLFIFAFIFSLIGFIKGLKTGAHRVLGIVAFVLYWVSVVVLYFIGVRIIAVAQYFM